MTSSRPSPNVPREATARPCVPRPPPLRPVPCTAGARLPADDRVAAQADRRNHTPLTQSRSHSLPDPPRAGRRPLGRGRAHKPRNRRSACRQRQDDRIPPGQHLRQTRRHLTHPTGAGAPRIHGKPLEILGRWLLDVCVKFSRGFPEAVVGAGNCVTSCDLGVFVDQAAEPVPPQNADTRSLRRADAARPAGGFCCSVRCGRWVL